MRIFDGHYYCVNKYMLSLVGLWPYQRRIERMILFPATVISIGCLTTSHVMVLIFSGKQWDILIETVSPILIQGVATIKIVNSMYHTDKIKLLIGRMEEHWKAIDASEKSDIMNKYAEGSRRMTIAYIGSIYVATAFYTSMPAATLLYESLLASNESLYLIPLYHYDLYLDVQKYQYQIFFLCMGLIFYLVTALIACDCLFVCFSQHVCGLFAMIQYDVERIQENESLNVDLVPPLVNDEPYHKIIKCIHKYNEALEYVDNLKYYE